MRIIRRTNRILTAAILAASLTVSACSVTPPWGEDQAATPPPSPPISGERQAIEAGLIPLVTFTGEEDQRPSLAARQAILNVPGASIAVMREHTLDWAAGYGAGVTPDTMFQAASLSKAVAATGTVALAAERGVDLDTDIAADLVGIDMAALNPEGVPITLRGLLSHTNGATVSGFAGYKPGENIPTTAGVIRGEGNSDAVMIEPTPAGTFAYSGGGYTLAQHWAESVTGEPFEAIMQRVLLGPVGMENSTFAMLAPSGGMAARLSPAYNQDGSPVEGVWHLYPEKAAAQLWSTPSDYLLFVRALMMAADGDTGTGIAPAVAREIITPVSEDYGLGIGVQTREEEIRLTHSGSNEGYKSNFMAFPARGDAIAVMVNAEGGFGLIGDINRTANIVYGWPATPLIERNRARVTAGELEGFTGDYAIEGEDEPIFTLTVDGDLLAGETRRGWTFDLVKIGPATFIDPQDAEEASFVTAPDGAVTVTTGGTTYRRLP